MGREVQGKEEAGETFPPCRRELEGETREALVREW